MAKDRFIRNKPHVNVGSLKPTLLESVAIDDLIRQYIDAVAVLRFPSFPPVFETLQRIPGLAQRLMALQGYLRQEGHAPGTVQRNWAWAQSEFEQFTGTPEDRLLSVEIRGVMRRFNDAKPGFRLSRGSKFRSLDTQIRFWNDRQNVEDVAKDLLKRMRKIVDQRTRELVGPEGAAVPFYPFLDGYTNREELAQQCSVPLPTNPSVALLVLADPEMGGRMRRHIQRAKALADFATVLTKLRKSGEVKTATPGISDHGQARAIDFSVVNARGTTVVGAGGARAWRSGGWDAALREAMRPSRHFHGPLRHPDEPWHYTFRP
jgi:hypothetical protein